MADNLVSVADVIGDALSRFGKAAAIDIESDDARSQVAMNIYNGTTNLAFGYHGWSFLRATRRCNLVDKASHGISADDPWPNGYTYCHRLPGDMIGFVRKFLAANNPGAKVTNLEREGLLVFSNHENLWVSASFKLEPEFWPLPWREAFTVLLAGRLALTESHDKDLKEDFLTQAIGTPSERKLPGGLFGRLLAQDLAENPPDSPFRHGDPLTDVRPTRSVGSSPWFGTF